MPTAAVIVGGAVLGAVSSRNSSKKAAGAAKDTSAAQIAATDRATSQARGDLFKLFPSAEANAQQGSKAALDVFGQFMPQQAQTFQQGNVAAQNQILAGMPQAHNALMGGAVDYSQFQPTQLNYNENMFQQQLPDFQNSQQALNPEPAQQQGAFSQFNNIGPNSFLGGNSGGFNNGAFGRQNTRIF